MLLRQTVPPSAGVRTVRRERDSAECLSSACKGGFCRDSFAPVLVRFAVICIALGAGVTGAITAAGGAVHETSPAQVFAPTIVPAPAPPVQLTASRAVLPIAAQDLSPSDLAHSRIDRVPYDFLIEEALASGTGNPDEILVFGPMRIRRHVVETIVKAARATETDPVLLMAIADKESSFSTEVKARTSSATGLFQFIESTWLRVVRQLGEKHGLEKEARAITWVNDELVIDPAERARILDLRREPYLSALLAAEMLKRDRARIAQAIGRDLSDSETYLAHFLGPDDAERFMAKVVDEPKSTAAKLLPKPARANKTIFFAGAGRKLKKLSVAEVHQKFDAMMAVRLQRYRNVHQVAGTTTVAEASAR